MMGIITYILINSIAVFVTSYLLKGGVKLDNFATAIVVAIVIGITNAVIKPLLLLLTLPLSIVTLGLFTFVINGLLILLVDYLVAGFSVKNIWWAILFSVVISLISSFLNHVSR